MVPTRVVGYTYCSADVSALMGRLHLFDHRFWYSARFPFSAEAAGSAVELGAEIKFPESVGGERDSTRGNNQFSP